MNSRHIFSALIALTCLAISQSADAMYHTRLGRFIQRDPTGYPDGMNAYAGYHIMHGGVDPNGKEVNEDIVGLVEAGYLIKNASMIGGNDKGMEAAQGYLDVGYIFDTKWNASSLFHWNATDSFVRIGSGVTVNTDPKNTSTTGRPGFIGRLFGKRKIFVTAGAEVKMKVVCVCKTGSDTPTWTPVVLGDSVVRDYKFDTNYLAIQTAGAGRTLVGLVKLLGSYSESSHTSVLTSVVLHHDIASTLLSEAKILNIKANGFNMISTGGTYTVRTDVGNVTKDMNNQMISMNFEREFYYECEE